MTKQIKAYDDYEDGFDEEEFEDLLKHIKRCDTAEEAVEYLDPNHDYPESEGIENITRAYSEFLHELDDNSYQLECFRTLENEMNTYVNEALINIIDNMVLTEDQYDELEDAINDLSIIRW